MSAPVPGPPLLRASVIVDYQNVHLTGSKLFYPNDALHEHLVHPGHFANQLMTVRNANVRDLATKARVCRVNVFRGLPSPKHDPEGYAFNNSHKSEWERGSVVTVNHRPLKYKYQYDAVGQRVHDIHGNEVVTGKQEKGIDVLCALAMVQEAARDDVDLVILASQDTDLEPSILAARDLGSAKVETVSWFDSGTPWGSREIRVKPAVWNTRLNKETFDRCVDMTNYTTR